MFTEKCKHPGCDWESKPKRSKNTAIAAVRMHVGRKHSQSIVNTPREKRRGPGRPRKQVMHEDVTSSNGSGSLALVALGNKYEGVKACEVKVDRRTRAWRENNPEAKPLGRNAASRRLKAVPMTALACPVCKYDFELLQKYGDPNHPVTWCPGCSLNLPALIASLTVAVRHSPNLRHLHQHAH